MILTALAALFGASLGLWQRNRLMAAGAAITLSGFAHAMIVMAALVWVGSIGDPSTIQLALAVAGAEPYDLGATIAAAGLAAIFAGLLMARERRREADAAKQAKRRVRTPAPEGQRIDVLLNR